MNGVRSNMNVFTRRGAMAVFVIACLPVWLLGCDSSDKGKAGGKQVLILGCDGMDPKLVTRLMAEGRLPNISKLAEEGGFLPLTTSIPPQSPVAWSNFITGAGPGVHGIFDFLHRRPEDPGIPYWSGNQIVTISQKEPLSIFKNYQYPRVEAENELLRRGTPFWEHLDARGIPVQMYRLPANYPPSTSEHGNLETLSDMGVPDALGNQGTYEFFSTKVRRESKGGEGYKLRLAPDYKSGAYKGKLYSIPNVYKEKEPEMFVELFVYPDPENDVAKIIYTNESPFGDETVELVLNVGEWSEWTEVHYLQTPIGPTFSTMTRFLLQEVRPNIRLFASPLNFIPTACPVPISEPPELVADMGVEIGPFYTQGFAEEYNALKHKVFTDEEYKTQSWYVMEERFRMLDYALDNFEEGLLYFYFSSTDLQAHMFWWDSDDPHPVREPEEARKYMKVVEDVYVKMDEALALCRQRLNDDATIILMSDHGFGNFRRGVAVNTWLQQEGYLVLTCEPQTIIGRVGRGVISDTDWTNTRAYSLGVGGSIYLNLQGREKDGIVGAGEEDALLDEIASKLLRLTDPETGKPVIARVYKSKEWYKGDEAKNAPDLILGYAPGYRSSWDTCLGGIEKSVIVDNTDAWSADHGIAHDLVPGILVTNRKISTQSPALIDVAPTVLELFDVSKPDYMTGSSFFSQSAPAKEKTASVR